MDEQELQARLRAADPARGPGPADSWIDDLVGATMDTETSNERPPGRRPWVLVVAAAAAVVAIGGGAFALSDGDDGDADPSVESEPPTVLDLTLPAPDAMQMCAALSPELLAPVQVAFSGEATEVDGTTVTLEPDHWYRGEEADLVVLEAPSPDVALEGGIAMEEGERYLISADGGLVSSCGWSGPYTEDLAAVYDEAFGG